jgi:L-ribulose-5-phosphate 3-epimerase UlaE
MLYLLNLQFHCMVISADRCCTLSSRDSKRVQALWLMTKSIQNQRIL